MKVLSARLHSIIGVIVGVALLLAPNVFAFSDVGGAAVMVPRVLGVLIILSELFVRGSFSNMGVVSMRTHVVLDVIAGLLLALSPWLFGFADEKVNAWLPHLVVGLAVVGYALITRTEAEDAHGTNFLDNNE